MPSQPLDDDLVEQHPGAIGSMLDWAGRLDQPGLALLAGKPGAALRNTADLAGDVVDAPIPGDWIHPIRHASDQIDPHQILGTDAAAHPTLARIEDVIGHSLANPLTIASLVAPHLLPKALRGIKSGLGAAVGVAAKHAPEATAKAQELAAKAGRLTRQVFGAERVTDRTKDIRAISSATGANVKQAHHKFLGNLFANTSDADQQALGQVMHGVYATGGRATGVIPGATLHDKADAYLASHPEVNKEWLHKAVDEIPAFNKRQWKEGQSTGAGGNVFYKPDTPDALPGTQTPVNTQGREQYFPRIFSGNEKNLAGVPKMGGYRSIKEASLEKPADIVSYMQAHPEVKLETNALKAMEQRAEQEGELAKRARAGREISGNKDFAYARGEDRQGAQEMIDKMAQASPEDARMLHDLFNGLPARGGIMNFLNKANRYFKPAAVFGALIPKIGSDVSNVLSGIPQVYAEPGVRHLTGTHIQNMLPNIIGSLNEGVRKVGGMHVKDWTNAVDAAVAKHLGVDNSTADLQLIEDAFKNSGGSYQATLKALKDRPDLASALEHGAISNNFVSTEKLKSEIERTGWKGVAKNWLDMPGTIYQATEQRMRLPIFKALLKEGKTPQEAARLTNDSFYDYETSSLPNRRARDLIPFWQYAAKAIPQQGKLLLEKPWLIPIANQLMNSSQGNPIYPFMQGRTNIPIGKDEQGQDEYISGLRLPSESLNMIPNLSDDPLRAGRQIEQSIVGSSQPLLKAAASYTFGRDPYFESAPGSYDKIPGLKDIPGLNEHIPSALGSDYNQLAATGMIQPVDSFLRQVGSIADPNHSLPVKALDLLTGVGIQDVDPHKALQQELQANISRDPTIQTYSSPYTRGGNEDTQQTLRHYHEAEAQLRADKKASNPPPQPAHGVAQPHSVPLHDEPTGEHTDPTPGRGAEGADGQPSEELLVDHRRARTAGVPHEHAAKGRLPDTRLHDLNAIDQPTLTDDQAIPADSGQSVPYQLATQDHRHSL